MLSFRVGTSKNKDIDHRVKETWLLCQLKLHMKPITSRYSVNQECQVYSIFVFTYFIVI